MCSFLLHACLRPAIVGQCRVAGSGWTRYFETVKHNFDAQLARGACKQTPSAEPCPVQLWSLGVISFKEHHDH